MELRSAEPSLVHVLTSPQRDQLLALYRRQWWSGTRTREEIDVLCDGPSILFGFVEPATLELIAFTRVLTDGIFKATIFDVIVHDDHRGTGLGARLIDTVLADPRVSRVRHLELYCRSNMLPFYRRWGFTEDLGDVVLMRREQ